jgi:hypothetical protein
MGLFLIEYCELAGIILNVISVIISAYSALKIILTIKSGLYIFFKYIDINSKGKPGK